MEVDLRTNNIVAKMKKGEMAYGCQFNSPSSEQVELLGVAGFDFVIFDGEHGTFTAADLEEQTRVAEMCGLTPIGMVPDVEAATIHSFLERGIMGIHGPNITTKRDAQKLAGACRYSPEGKRSLSFSRATHFGSGPSRPEYMAHANSQMLVSALIEHVDALKDLDGILAVEGIGLYGVGPKDLAQSMGLPGQMDHPRVKEFESRVSDAVHARGKKMSYEVISVQRASQPLPRRRHCFQSCRRAGLGWADAVRPYVPFGIISLRGHRPTLVVLGANQRLAVDVGIDANPRLVKGRNTMQELQSELGVIRSRVSDLMVRL